MDTILALLRDRNYAHVIRECRDLEPRVRPPLPSSSITANAPDPHCEPQSRLLRNFHPVISPPKRIVRLPRGRD